MSDSPLAARRRLGAELRRLRLAAGMLVTDAAEAIDCSTAKISRLENGKGIPKHRDVRDLVAEYTRRGAREQEDVLALAEGGRAQDWSNKFSDLLQGEVFTKYLQPTSSGRFIELQQDAAAIDLFEDKLIPGLLQTKEYAEAICTIWFPQGTEEERARFVQLRLDRQETLLRRSDPPRLNVLVAEAALLLRVGGSSVVRRQFEFLVSALGGSLGFIDFRLPPIGILKYENDREQDVIQLEGREGTRYLETDEDVARYESLFLELQKASLSPGASIDRLQEEISTIRRQEKRNIADVTA